MNQDINDKQRVFWIEGAASAKALWQKILVGHRQWQMPKEPVCIEGGRKAVRPGRTVGPSTCSAV